jgi:3-mercaptopyruvate sulfurtransferase SseA
VASINDVVAPDTRVLDARPAGRFRGQGEEPRKVAWCSQTSFAERLTFSAGAAQGPCSRLDQHSVAVVSS